MEVTSYLKFLLVIWGFASTDACVPRISGSSSLTIKVGFNHTFTCSYSSCDTNQTLYWRINGNKQTDGVTESYSTTITTENNITTITYNGSSDFTYSPSRPASNSQNNVVVYCFAGTRNYNVEVTIHYGPDEPTLNKTGSMDIVEYSAVPRISCSSSCNPACTYQFWKDGNQVLSSTTGIFIKNSVLRSYTGTYTCRASNLVSHKKSVQTFSLNVLHPPTFSLTRLPSSSLLEEGTSVTFLFKPTTHGNPRSYDFLECNHTADGRYLRRMYDANDTQQQIQFVIENVSFTDRGSYTCGVTNGIQDSSGNSVIKGSRNLDLKTPPLILMDTKNKTRSDDGNWTLSIDFISLNTQPEAYWIYLADDKAPGSIESIGPRQISYEIEKENIIYNIPSYLTKIKAKDAGKYVAFIKNDMGREVVEYTISSPGTSEVSEDRPAALIAAGSVFLVVGIICIGVALFLLYKTRQQKTKLKETSRQRHPSLYVPPSVDDVDSVTRTNEYQQSIGVANPAEVELSVANQEGPYITPQNTDATPKIIKPPVGEYKRQQNEVKNVLYVNNEIKNESVKEKYVTVLAPGSEQAPFYETPQTLMAAKAKGRSKPKKDQNPYANQKAKNRKGDAKHYANVDYKAGKAYENHMPGS